MKLIFKIITTLILLIIFSCSENKHKFSLRIADKISINALDSTNGKYYYESIYYDKLTHKEYFLWLNNLSNSIDFFSIDNGKFRFCITINKSNKINEYYIKNLDSIFILYAGKNIIGLYNRKGDLLSEYNFNRFMKDSIFFHSSISLESPFLFKFNNFYFDITPFKSIDVKKYLRLPKLAIINIEKEHVLSVLKTVYFPKKYLDSIDYNFYTPSYCLSKDGKIIVSFEVSHKIYIYNSQNGSLIKTVQTKSKYLNKFNGKNKFTSSNLKDDFKFQIVSPHYSGIYYDEYRNYYYRVAIHKQKLIDKHNLPNHTGSNPWSIIIFDENFKKLSEIFIEGKKYFPHIFITKKGLLLLNLKKYYAKQPNKYFDFDLLEINEEN